ncbi:hypothetical protein K439DRAFT_348554 [Ramaria rubella]|nr:hypothetical protein K439DRAFT_348554 [Ramaria rubella]
MAPSDFTISEARLVGLFMQSMFFGVYLVSFAALIRVMFFSSRANSIHRPMLAAAIAMFIVATLGVTSLLKRNFDAFIWYHGPGGSDAEFEDISNPINVLLFATYYAQTIIGDLILIYRCFIVYNRSWLVISIPAIIWLATLVCSSIGINKTNNLDTSANIDDKSLIPWITSILVLTMVQNLATTSLIAIRIWRVEREVMQYRKNPRMKKVFKMVIESGAIYTLSVFVLLVTYLCSNNGQYPVSNCIVQIIGIVFNTIIIRVHQGRTAEHEMSTNVNTHPMSFAHGTFVSDQTRSRGDFPVQSVHVNVKQQTTTGESDGLSTEDIASKDSPEV